jgi:hypothetical protein
MFPIGAFRMASILAFEMETFFERTEIICSRGNIGCFLLIRLPETHTSFDFNQQPAAGVAEKRFGHRPKPLERGGAARQEGKAHVTILETLNAVQKKFSKVPYQKPNSKAIGEG